MGTPPPAQVISAIENGVAQITRRIEFYENDAITRWYPDKTNDPDTDRLVDGSITIDSNSDERRKADLTLLNDDFKLRLNPNGGFYYDKVVKLFRGVKYSSLGTRVPVALIESDYTGDTLTALIRSFAIVGYDVADLRSATTLDEIAGYPIVTTFRNVSTTSKSALLKLAYLNGQHILTTGWGNTSAEVPHIATTAANTGAATNFRSIARDHPLKAVIPATTGNITAGSAVRVTALTAQGILCCDNVNDSTEFLISVGIDAQGTKWFDFHCNANLLNITVTAALQPHLEGMLDYMATGWITDNTWETQLGEFMIDGANDQIFPNQIKLTVRDYTKKLLKDKLTFTSSFAAGTSLKTFIRSIAANGGITKFREAIGDEVFPNDVVYERSTPRWQIIKEVCTAFDYEVYFDNQGYLVVRKFKDPTTAPIFHTFQTGSAGNLVSFARSVNDSRIFNIINIYGDPVSNDRLPYFGQAINDDPSSPTSTQKLNNRPWDFAANYFASDAECEALARSRLKIMALESYEINYASIFYPWMEAGEIVSILDPNRAGSDPTRFLMDQITLPIQLGPMSGTGKRVTLVGSTG
jgi:hypothetical protein